MELFFRISKKSVWLLTILFQGLPIWRLNILDLIHQIPLFDNNGAIRSNNHANNGDSNNIGHVGDGQIPVNGQRDYNVKKCYGSNEVFDYW